MYTTCRADPPTNAAAGTVAVAAAATPRLFDRLDRASKERVTLLLSRVQTLLPIEQEAFYQELHRQQEEAQRELEASNKTRGKLVRYTGPALQAVQARDCGYVVPRALNSGENSGPQLPQITDGRDVRNVSSVAAPPCSLEELMHTPGMFGEQEVAVHLEKISLYDKLHQNMANARGSRTTLTATETSSNNVHGSMSTEQLTGEPQPPPQAEEEEQTNMELQTASAAVDAGAPRSTAPYRSNTYQAVRLALSSPGFIAAKKPSSMALTQTGHDGVKSVMNMTGMPISEDDLREWFDELDEEGRGALSLEEFQRYMRSLERDFGVTEEYVALQRAGEALAFDGRLNFESFAYLVLRFASM